MISGASGTLASHRTGDQTGLMARVKTGGAYRTTKVSATHTCERIMAKTIDQAFHEYFEIVAANTDALRTEVYRLRYQVYCLETGLEDPVSYPKGLESDEYDAMSVHTLIRHRATGLYAATTRLILPSPEDPERLFPTERYAQVQIPDAFAPANRRHLAEISRFCVSKEFKRRRGERGTTTGLDDRTVDECLSTIDERRTFPHITLALIASLTRMSAKHQITHWYALMEEPLIRFLSVLGIRWTAVGPVTEHHGRRVPCIMQVPEHLLSVRDRNAALWDLLSDHGRLWTLNDPAAAPC